MCGCSGAVGCSAQCAGWLAKVMLPRETVPAVVQEQGSANKWLQLHSSLCVGLCTPCCSFGMLHILDLNAATEGRRRRHSNHKGCGAGGPGVNPAHRRSVCMTIVAWHCSALGLA